MVLAKVVGTIVSTLKDEKMRGLKFLLLRQVDLEGKLKSGQVVAVDSVGAGEGEYVLYASGSSARQTHATKDKPCDTVVMAIVDNWEIGGDIIYKKGETD